MDPATYDGSLTVEGGPTYAGFSTSTLNELRCAGDGPVLNFWLAARSIGHRPSGGRLTLRLATSMADSQARSLGNVVALGGAGARSAQLRRERCS